VSWVTRAPVAFPGVLLGWTMRIGWMLVPDLAEKVNFVHAREERRSDRVYRRIAPTLSLFIQNPVGRGGEESVGLSPKLGCLEGVTIPRSRSRRDYRGTQRTRCRPRRAKSPYRRSQSYSKLFSTVTSQPRRHHDGEDQKPLRGPRGEGERGRTVAESVVDAAVIGEEGHRVVLCHVFRVLPNEIYVLGERDGRHEPQARGSTRHGTYREQWTIATRSYVGIRTS
jgi:hypothetical protein